MKRRVLYLCLSVMLVLGTVLSACAPQATPTAVPVQPTKAVVPTTVAPTAAPAKKLTLALVTKALDNPFWGYMHDAASKLATEKGFELIYLAPTKANNLEEQTRLVDDLIQKKVDGIVLVPVDTKGMVAAVERANAAGIPVAISNTRLAGGKIVTFAAIENYDAMTLVAEYMVKKLGEKGKVVIIEGTAGAQTAIDRKKAQDDVLKKYPNITVLASQTAEFSRATALTVMENLLQTYPEIDAVFCGNDEEALGAIEALKAANRMDKTLVAGFDANADALKAVMEGRMAVTCDQRPDLQANQALQAILDQIAGKTVEARTKITATLVDKSNVDQYAYRIK
jgi:ribose transport system substrate-binding protein